MKVFFIIILIIGMVKSDPPGGPSSQCEMQCLNLYNPNTQKFNLEECRNDCRNENSRNRNITGLIIILVVTSIALIVLTLCCCYYKKIKTKYVQWDQNRKRKINQQSMVEGQFDRYAQQFKNIFTQGARNQWEFYYNQGLNAIPMQWFTMQIDKVKPFQYHWMMTGQDKCGTWSTDGFFVHTDKGITVWWFKRYQNSNYHKDQRQFLIYQGQRNEDETYSGYWYFRGYEQIQNLSGLWKLGHPQDNNVNDVEVRIQVESVPNSDILLQD